MNTEFKKVLDMAAKVKPVGTETLEELNRKLAEAEAAEAKAAEAKLTAANEEQFTQACDDAIRAREKKDFYSRMVEKHKFSMNMDEADYNAAVASVEAVVKKAAEEFRMIAEKSMNVLTNARKAYEQIIADADQALIALDDAANVLQSKYRYRKVEYVGKDPQLIEDSGEWKKHALRFNDPNRKGVSLVTEDPCDNKLTPYNVNRVLYTAWRAAEKGAKE